jgi:hypothetical protein
MTSGAGDANAIDLSINSGDSSRVLLFLDNFIETAGKQLTEVKVRMVGSSGGDIQIYVRLADSRLRWSAFQNGARPHILYTDLRFVTQGTAAIWESP